MKLRKGSTFAWADIQQDENGFILRQCIRVGKHIRAVGKVKRFKREEELLLELARRIDERLSQLGREKITP